jgi:uncharacterized membrane protein YkoI
MTGKTWIMIVCCVALAAIVCAVTYAEKGEKGSLPAAIEAAVKALMPNATIEKSKLGEEKVSAYEIDVKDNSKEAEVTVAEDGTAIDVEYTETMDTVPAAVSTAIKAQNAEIKEVVKVVEYARVKVVKLDAPVTSYEAEIIKDGKKMEVEFAADGKILKQKVMEEKK